LIENATYYIVTYEIITIIHKYINIKKDNNEAVNKLQRKPTAHTMWKRQQQSTVKHNECIDGWQTVP
jgi:hypothetical protein